MGCPPGCIGYTFARGSTMTSTSVALRERTAADITDTSADFELTDDDRTREIYPFPFVLRVRYSLESRGIRLPLAVYNRGISGFTTAELLASMDVCVYALRPSKIFINIGTNDLNGPDYAEEALIRNYRKILEGIREQLPGTKLYVMAYYPVCPAAARGHRGVEEVLKWRTKERIGAANEAVRHLAEELGADYLNCNAQIMDENGYMKEEYAENGLHMLPDGYEKVLAVLLPYMKE